MKEMKKKSEQVQETEVSAAKKIAYADHPAFKNDTEMSSPVALISRLPHVATISYDGESIMVPPGAAGKNAVIVGNKNKLGALPKGVEAIPVK